MSVGIYLGFAAEVGELFAKGKHAGLTHEQLIKVFEGQLDMEKRLKATADLNQRSYA